MSVSVTLSASDAAVVAQADDRVPVRDPAGKLIGFLDPLDFGMSDEEAIRMSEDPNTKWVTADEVMARLRSLDGRQ